jgi:hypothetical protein
MPAYRKMSTAARCAVRVVAHTTEIERLSGVLGRRLLTLRYEDIHKAPHAEFERISQFLGLATPAEVPMPREESRRRWQSQLSASERADIVAVAKKLGATDYLEVPDSGPANPLRPQARAQLPLPRARAPGRDRRRRAS